jgi:hypothetical protein
MRTLAIIWLTFGNLCLWAALSDTVTARAARLTNGDRAQLTQLIKLTTKGRHERRR